MIAVVALLFVFTGAFLYTGFVNPGFITNPSPGAISISTGTGTAGTGGPTEICDIGSASPTHTESFINYYSKGTAVTADYMYRLKGETKWVDGRGSSASIAGSPYEVYELWVGINQTTGEPGVDNEAYGQYKTIKLPCADTQAGTTEVKLIGTPSSMTVTKLNSDGATVNDGVSDNQTMTANAEYRLKFKVSQGESDKEFGSTWTGTTLTDGAFSQTKPNILICRYNTTVIDDLELDDETGTGQDDIGVPAAEASTTGYLKKAWPYPAVIDSGETPYYTVVVDTDDSVAFESVAQDYNTPHVNCSIHDGQYYHNAKNMNNKVEFGTESDQDAYVGAPSSINFQYYLE